MTAILRYFRLLTAFARYSLARELAFRGNFVVKIIVELLWLAIVLIFYRTVFAKTSHVADWSETEYLFFVGCYFSMEALIETLFLGNCNEFSDLVRTGDLDVFLLQPIDEQFLVTCRDIDWSTMPNVFLGCGLMGISLYQTGWTFDAAQVLAFLSMYACGAAIAYAFLLMLMSSAVWFVRNQSLMELWWLFSSLMRYPKEIFAGRLAAPVGWFFTFIVPVMLVVNVPARVMVKVFDPWTLAFTAVVTVILLFVSRRFFRYALRKYRSASS